MSPRDDASRIGRYARVTSSDTLASRLDAEFEAAREHIRGMHAESVRISVITHTRFMAFTRLRERVNDLVAPRLEQLHERLPGADTASVPSPHGDTVSLRLASGAAKITLALSLSHDGSLGKAFLDYDLEILPVFIRFDRHARLEIPLDSAECDDGEIARWLDDRIVGFVHTYREMQFVGQYRGGDTVTDPVARISFQRVFAQSSLEHGGKTYHFLSEQTRREFEEGPAPYTGH
jgi:YHS domain-containing protein